MSGGSGQPAPPRGRTALQQVWAGAARSVREVAEQTRQALAAPSLGAAAALCPAEADRVRELLRRALDDRPEGLSALAHGLLLDTVRLARPGAVDP
ncbi:hypothetical protein [Peterkaempfera griseoplana]|uniref:hypothetical protein n=1 Tax=Peterkaempfera griseoplana TaxID=66896 RepID=UPI0006E29787|nr:hypothetical protein [Peterkaempfera griseoplana]